MLKSWQSEEKLVKYLETDVERVRVSLPRILTEYAEPNLSRYLKILLETTQIKLYNYINITNTLAVTRI